MLSALIPWNSTNASSSQPQNALSDFQRRMYDLEEEDNFRWLSRCLATKSPYILTSADLASADLQLELAELGQFAEAAQGSMAPEFIWRNISLLSRPNYPLEGYNVFEGSTLASCFHGKVANLQGFIASRPENNQLVVAFSGTSSGAQALHDVDARKVIYDQAVSSTARVHAGFWRLYQGIRDFAVDGLRRSMEASDVKEIVLTGHSMGGALSFLLALELLTAERRPTNSGWNFPRGITIKLAVFGSPRVGNAALSQLYRAAVAGYRNSFGEAKFQEYSVKGYNDGVHALPPNFLGYCHLTPTPLYFYHGSLYHIPFSECEHSSFTVACDEEEATSTAPDHPWGGHNYYNGRDMEKFIRRMRWLDINASGEQDWENRYLKRLAEEQSRTSTNGQPASACSCLRGSR